MNAPCFDKSVFLSNILRRKVLWNGKKIGKLDDLVIKETDVVPQVTHVVVSRSFGYESLVVPYENVEKFTGKHFHLNMKTLEQFARANLEGLSLLNDHIMDKKVVDMEDHEVEVVYDIKLAHSCNGIFVTDVDCSRYSFLRRIGLGKLAHFIQSMAESLKDETISWKYVQPLSKELGSFTGAVKLNILKDNIREIHPMDLADILEELNQEQRITIFNTLNDEKASDTLEEIEPRVQREIITAIGDEKAADLIEDMTPAQAADVLSALPASDADDILALIDEKEKARKIEALMEDHDKSIMDFVTTNFIKFPPETTVAEVFAKYKDVAKDMDAIWYIYVVTEKGELVGEVNFHSVLRAEPTQRMEDIMVTSVKSLQTDDPLTEAAKIFEKYMFRAVPVIDENEIIQGVILYKDVMRLTHRILE
jgi:CBS domain-containing protein/sporulation protein YlmC with PRC-barrel domain